MFKIGQGYDVHRLEFGRKLILGGVEIPYKKGLMGHSDADVLVHAIIDALLGAGSMGDIGTLFPDTDSKYKDIDSLELLSIVITKIEEDNYKINNIDATIIAEKPKMQIYIDKMRENIAKICKIEKENVSIKATTEEKMGFTGQEKGISALAVCLLTKERNV